MYIHVHNLYDDDDNDDDDNNNNVNKYYSFR